MISKILPKLALSEHCRNKIEIPKKITLNGNDTAATVTLISPLYVYDIIVLFNLLGPPDLSHLYIFHCTHFFLSFFFP